MVGVGSDLRRDDAVGRVVVERVETLAMPGVAVRSVTQLVPELVEEMIAVDLVVFVDAALGMTTVGVQRSELRRSDAGSHHGSPGSLLALADVIGGPVPEAFIVSVPVTDLGLGTGLTPGCEAHIGAAVEAVVGLVA